jgi:hypothetical protein
MAGGSSSDTGVLFAANGLKITVTQVVLESSYVTGGTALTPQQLGQTNAVVFAISSLAAVGANGPSEVRYNIATGKLQAYGAAGEVTSATNLSASVAEIIAFGY